MNASLSPTVSALRPTSVVDREYGTTPPAVETEAPVAIYSDYEPRTNDPGPFLWAFVLGVCLVTYLVLLPLVVGIKKRCCSGDHNDTNSIVSSGGSRKRRRFKKGFTGLLVNGGDEDAEAGDALKGFWDQFQDEEYSATPSKPSMKYPEIEVQWHGSRQHNQQQQQSLKGNASSSSILGSLAVLLTSVLELHTPQLRSFFYRQRQLRRKRALHWFLREESTSYNSHDTTVDSNNDGIDASDYPLLRGNNGAAWAKSILGCCADKKLIKRMTRLMKQFVTPTLCQGILQIATLVILGLTLRSTSDLAAYVIVQVLIVKWTLNGVSSAWFGALQKLTRSNFTGTQTGQYTQITMFLLVTFSMPLWVIWTLSITPVLQWLQMDEQTISAAVDYTYIALVLNLLKGLSECVHFLLVRAKHGTYSTTMILLEEAFVLVAIALWTWLDKADLVTFGLVQLELAVTFLVWNVGVALYSGWLQAYQGGLLGACSATDRKVLSAVMETAIPMILGNVFLGSTWEILMFLAAFLGPAEFTAWCILGVLWEALTSWLEGMACVVSLRCEALMLLGRHEHALQSSIKATVGLIALPAVLLALALFAIPEGVLATWITRDETLQSLLTDLLPLLEIGLVVTAIGYVTWALMNVQGRNHVAAFVAWLATWFVAIPLATTFSVHLLLDLQGQTVSFILGSLLMGAIQCCLFVTFQWDESAKDIATTTTLGHSIQSSNPSSQKSPPLLPRPPRPSPPRHPRHLTSKVRDNEQSTAGSSQSAAEIEQRRFQRDRAWSTTSRSKHSSDAPDPGFDQPSTSSSSDSEIFDDLEDYDLGAPFDEIDAQSNEASSWHISDDSTLSTGGSSLLTMSTFSGGPSTLSSNSGTMSSSQQNTVPTISRIYSMDSGSSPNSTKAKARNMSSLLSITRSAGPMSPVQEEASTASSASMTFSDWMAASVSSAGSITSNGSKRQIGSRRRSDLGYLSEDALAKKQEELSKMLNALKATRRYELNRSKLRILEELRWMLLESPDIFEIKHLERIIGLLQVDEDCRKELWSPLCQYLPGPLRRMGLDRLLQNDYLGPHHLKARMDKFVLDSRLGDASANGSAQDDVDSYVDDEKVHRACELPTVQFGFPSCFAMQK
ncbi:Mate efflux family protein [Seminavis robusta]|uniref:Mate efflux family protein n=1 Tax=Seminavis robusta TaxID=568900 RepID=A0A9N8DR07_9STRA|nr:Mate efflux family protein [Seminavis robusta]|eukprot:Sro290_g109350.1 Mate efflux family protein (1125) ;mRNA; f:46570-50123